MQNIPIVSHVADARANFDRNMKHLVSRALLSRQFPLFAVEWYKEFLESQELMVRTAFGVSEKPYKRGANNRIWGDGQGLAWSAINQIIISSVIDNVYNKLSEPYELMDHTGQIIVKTGVGYFIDDRVTNSMLPLGVSKSELLKIAQKNELIQTQALNAAGGALAPNKCKVYVLVRNEDSLNISYLTEKSFPGTIHLSSTTAYSVVPIKRVPPTMSVKYLGALINPMYNMSAQYAKLKEIIEDWKTKVTRGDLSTQEVIKSLQTTLMKQLEYPLVASTLSFQQCDSLMGIIRATLARENHYHSKLKTEITHGPVDLSGFNFPHIYDMQGQAKLRLLHLHATKSIENSDTFMNLFDISLSNHQLWLGKFYNFLEDDFDEIGHILCRKTWTASLWEYLTRRNLKFDYTKFFQYTLPRVNDKYIMDIVREQVPDKKKQMAFNRVRMNYNILSLSDIMLDDGQTIHPGIVRGNQLYRKSSFNWPRKEKDNDAWIKVFKEIIQSVFIPMMEDESNHLGATISQSHMSPVLKRIDDNHVTDGNNVFQKTKYLSYWRLHTHEFTKQQLESATPTDMQPLSRFTDRVYDITRIKPYQFIQQEPEPTPEQQDWKRILWGSTDVTEDIINKLIDIMRKPHIMASDGGQPEGKGVGAYAFLIADIQGNIIYKSSGVSDTIPSQYASTRLEGLGMLAGITLINHIEEEATKRGITLSKNRIFVCDNLTIASLQKSSKIPYTYFKAKHRDVILQIIMEWRKNQNNPEQIVKVESHLDKKKNMKLEEMTILEQMNWWADDYCTHAYEHQNPRQWELMSNIKFPAQLVSVGTALRKFVAEKPREYDRDRTRKELEDVIKEKNNFTDETFDKIAWQSFGKLLTNASHSRRIQIMKVVHEKWITNREQAKMKQHSTGHCPNCGLHEETTSHVFECTHDGFQEYKTIQDMRVIKTVNGGIVPDTVLAFIHEGLQTQSLPTDISNKIQMVEPIMREMVLKAIEDQTIIGWDKLRKGFVSKYWAESLQIKAKYTKNKFDHQKWERDLINALWDRSIALWQKRCKIASEGDDMYVDNLQIRAETDLAWLKKNRTVIGTFRNLIRYPKGYFLRAQQHTIEFWNASIRDARRTTELHARNVKNTLFSHKFTSKRKQRRSRTIPRNLPSEQLARNHARNVVMARTPCLEYFFNMNHTSWRYRGPPKAKPRQPPDPLMDDIVTESDPDT